MRLGTILLIATLLSIVFFCVIIIKNLISLQKKSTSINNLAQEIFDFLDHSDDGE